MGNINGGGVSVNGGGMGCNNGNGGGGGGAVVGPGQQHQHHLEVQPDYHSSEHRHSFPALYYEGGNESPLPAQKASFLKPLGRTKRDATATYSQLSPSRHHNYNSGYSSSPEYSSESTLRIWERFRPYKKSPREEASYIAAGHALRKKVQFAKDEDLHDILDYWKGVSAQQKLMELYKQGQLKLSYLLIIPEQCIGSVVHCNVSLWSPCCPAIDYRQQQLLPGATGGTVKVAR
ncbi:hypothetical protein F7725_006220 [Dissostichus mawsoni]|uniref:Uncharacterized protein n=1 Tax=Dissostichus mawsoni TaxID=36200 RepID=A0A7J5YTQ6_DISMA|nr:hypothetical protein F7725_006220 [Dissostichus mawsoni]